MESSREMGIGKRSRLLKGILCSAWLFALGSSSAWAFNTATHQEIARDAIKISPTYLQMVLAKNEESVLRGAAGPEKNSFDGTKQNFQQTDLPTQIEKIASEIKKLLKSPKSLPDAAYQFGLLSYYAANASNPLNVANDDVKEPFYHELFSEYVEKEMKNFRVVVRGFTPNLFGDLTCKAYFDGKCAKTARYYPTLSKEFTKGGKIASIRTFSHQSVPFAVASLSYGNAVTTTTDVWRNVWRTCGGTLKGSPGAPKAVAKAPAKPPVKGKQAVPAQPSTSKKAVK